jgi:hypothetical protein
MPSYSRELTLLGLIGATLWLPQCSQLTKVDWSAIRPGGGASGEPTSGTAGSLGGGAGVNTEAGEGGIAGGAGESGAAGEGDVVDPGGGGASAGIGGVGGSAGIGGNAGIGGTLGGTGGAAGSAGAAGAILFHPTCETAPPAPTTPPDFSGKIIFFDGGKGTNGARGGRGSSVPPYSGLDGACATAKQTLQLPGSEVHAVISVDPLDEIFDMPALYHLPAKGKPIVSPFGIELAAEWNSLWLAGYCPSLVCTGVMPVGTKTWLSGTGSARQAVDQAGLQPAYGTYSGIPHGENETCEGWSTGDFSNSVRAQVGSAIANNDQTPMSQPYFIIRLIKSCDVATDNILCATYDP